MNKAYLLHHYYILEGVYDIDEVKFIGVFNSVEDANDTIERFSKLEGFKDHDKSCFIIDEYTVDKKHWINGFIKNDSIDIPIGKDYKKNINLIGPCSEHFAISKYKEEKYE